MKFEEVNQPIHQTETMLPTRATRGSAGNDLRLKEDIQLKSGESNLTFTDVKAKFPSDHVMLVFIRSSLAKSGIQLANSVGVIDSDYYNNPQNDGNIGLQLLNNSENTITLKAGKRVAQAVILPYLAGEAVEGKRSGGFGSSGSD